MNHNYLPTNHLLHQRYLILSNIGQGGFGITYLAYDKQLNRKVCIKELFIYGNCTRGTNLTVISHTLGDFSFADFENRFVQEANQLAKFQHPNIVRVLEIFQENNTAYMVMEFVEGETLKQKVKREGALNEKIAMSLISQLLEAVDEVHSKGMLHKDIKPDNVLISPDDRLVLIDFGSAREFAEGKNTTQMVMNSSGYAPKEQYSTKAKRGPFTDIYALGATLYFLLTGENPIPVLDRNLEELVSPHQKNNQVSTQVSSAVMLAMELEPENRFQTVKEMREAIKILEAWKEESDQEVITNDTTEGEDKVGDTTITTGDDAGGIKKCTFKFPMKKLLLGLLIGVSVVLISLFGVELLQQKRNDPSNTTLKSTEEKKEKPKLEEKKPVEKEVESLVKEKINDPELFYCKGDGQPIRLDKYQNGTCDCPDGSDELPGTCK